MYEERKEKFSFKSFFLTLLLVLLFVFLMLWLFPTKSYLDDKLKDSDTVYDLNRLSVLYDEIFANNVSRMKEAAIGYFTNERMPKEVGKSKKLTLQEMYDLHLVLKMKDKDGNPCDTTKSDVEMTKYTEEYRLKVNLSCGKQEDYIIVYLGCYSYCPGGICEKTVSVPSATTAKEEKEYSKPDIQPESIKYYCKVVDDKYYDKDGNAVNKADYDKSCNPSTPTAKKHLYEYKLTLDDSTSCSAWSKWQKESVKATDLIKVETKKENEIVSYNTVKVPKTITETITKQVTEKYISKYVTQLVLVGTKEVQVGTTTKTVTEKVQVGTVEVATGKIGTGSIVPKDTATIHYKVISSNTLDNCSYCENQTIYTWEEYKVEPVYDVVTRTVTVPVYKTINVYESREVPVYDFRVVEKQEQVTKTVYETKKVPVYGNVTYYRYQSCKINKGYTDIKWSETKFDADLLGKGYKLTGNVKQV